VSDLSRRELLASVVVGAAVAAAPHASAAEGNAVESRSARGLEGQRKADRGDGTFLNPILAGDHPDPSILKDGDDYYMTFSSFDSYPGVVLWHSRDLINWTPLATTLKTPIGSVWACELVKHAGRYYIYIPARKPDYRSIYVIHADTIAGPWSEPIDLDLPNHIDPGHVVGEDGKRYLFLSGGDRVRLTDDGLATDGDVAHVYDPWKYPDEWIVESFSPEGPKVTRRGEWFYLLTAVGGTAGPPTGHMVIAARSRSIHGPWENCPHNPLVRTHDASERWWSRGHATLVEAPDHSWWMVYHGYENGYWTLGRQTLLDPIEWTDDGWLRAKGGDLAAPLAKPAVARTPSGAQHGFALSDDFTRDKLGVQWGFYDPAPDEGKRLRRERGSLVLAGKGTQPRDASPLTFVTGDRAYSMSVQIELEANTQAGVLLFYNRRLYCGLGVDARGLTMHRYGLERRNPRPVGFDGKRLHLRIANDRHIVTIHHSLDGWRWTKFAVQMETSGYHHNVAGDFLSLRPALFAAGTGNATFRDVRYTAL
jgi:xylan 1,4-beta-xylosidase